MLLCFILKIMDSNRTIDCINCARAVTFLATSPTVLLPVTVRLVLYQAYHIFEGFGIVCRAGSTVTGSGLGRSFFQASLLGIVLAAILSVRSEVDILFSVID